MKNKLMGEFQKDDSVVATQSLVFLNAHIKIEKLDRKTKNLCTFSTKLSDEVVTEIHDGTKVW